MVLRSQLPQLYPRQRQIVRELVVLFPLKLSLALLSFDFTKIRHTFLNETLHIFSSAKLTTASSIISTQGKSIVTEGTAKRRLTTSQKEEKRKAEERHEQTKKILTDLAVRSNKIRSKDKEFHGLEREFFNLQSELLSDYEKSKDIKHPRDVGSAREVLLRAFFLENKLLPKKYAVSETSVRVASTSGHLSNELDLLFYNALDSFSLMQRQNVYEVLPVEYTYGAIQVKSKLTKHELKSAFANIASYKNLKRIPPGRLSWTGNRKPELSGFGIIFAYDTDLDWSDIVEQLKHQAAQFSLRQLPNAIFILSKGCFFFGDDSGARYYNTEMCGLQSVKIHAFPDNSGHCLYQLYDIVFGLCEDTLTHQVRPHQYVQLPLTAGEHSYRYSIGGFAEIGVCAEHGDYARSYTPERLETVISWCQTAEPINWVKAIDLAYGRPGDNIEAYEKQPGDVRVYNPDSLPLTEILVRDDEMTVEGKVVRAKSLAFDIIESGNLRMCIPYYYQVKDGLVQGCTQCTRKAKKSAKKKAGS